MISLCYFFQQDTLAERLGLCSLSDFSEGLIGKLQVRKSGRTQLLLGNVALDVAMGTPPGFLQVGKWGYIRLMA